MKKILFIMPLMAISLLASCGNKEEPKDEEYEVTFSVPNDEATILYGDKTQIVKWGEAPTKPKKDPYRVGYKFTGWYKDEKCSKVFDFGKDHIEGTTTLYSGWEEDPKFAIPLCFTSNVDENTLVKNEQFYYKNNLSDDWAKGKGETMTLRKGAKIYIGSDNKYEDADDLPLPSGSFNASGNIMSLIDSTNFKFSYKIVRENQFDSIFYGYDTRPSYLVDASDLLLPATKLDYACYQYMFGNSQMLVKVPDLPAITLADDCYRYMFDDCSKLTKAPELSATTLADYCYEGMFEDCGLVEAPELPVITLAIYCYKDMFAGCKNLVKAPELPATTLVDDCYESMFYGCEKLNYIKVGFGDGTDGWPGAKDCTYLWLYGVSATGTFVWRGSPEGPSTRGVDRVPDGWTIETY